MIHRLWDKTIARVPGMCSRTVTLEFSLDQLAQLDLLNGLQFEQPSRRGHLSGGKVGPVYTPGSVGTLPPAGT